ncbi:MAG TPA: hypothetical protein DCS55_24075 [Acidimicrobiaceae bacterium]|nr:hypothetical protein [Acidimicrobiaceae bacterium]
MTGEAGEGDPGIDDDEREARLAALLSVRVAARQDELGPGPLEGRRRRTTTPGDDAREDDPDDRAGSGRRIGLTTVLATLVLLGLFATGAGLIYAGTRIIRSSTEGEVVAEQTDPAAPGYEAIVSPTPTMLVVHDVDGAVEALTVLTLPSPGSGGGGVVLVPTRTISDMPIFGYAPIEAAYDLGTAEVQAEVVGDVLTTGIGEVVVVDADRWAGLVAPVAPLTIDNPEAIEVDGELRFPDGEIELEAEDVGAYLAARAPGESDPARLFRHETFWRAWLAAVAEAGTPDAVPGELEGGIGRFVRELAAGATVVETLPVEPTTVEGFDDEATFVADEDDVAALIAELVPFPRSPRPDVRERVRVLNGTEDLGRARAIAPALPPVGVEVVIVGNAFDLDQATTTIAYVDPSHEAAAEDIRELLGVGEVLVDPRPSDVVDITVTLGADHD